MFGSRTFTVVCMFMLPLSQISCVVESEQPLSEPEKSTPDERLFGQWKATENGVTTFFFVGKPQENSIKNCPPGLGVIYTISRSAKNEVWADETPGYFFVTKIGKESYQNLVEFKDRKKISHWEQSNVARFQPLKYSIDKDRLTVWIMNLDAAAQAVDTGKLKGKVTRKLDKKGVQNGPVQSVILKDSTENLVKFLEKGGNTSLFTDKGKLVLERVKW